MKIELNSVGTPYTIVRPFVFVSRTRFVKALTEYSYRYRENITEISKRDASNILQCEIRERGSYGQYDSVTEPREDLYRAFKQRAEEWVSNNYPNFK